MLDNLEPAGLPEEAEKLSTRSISIEEQFSRQSDRVAYLRSMGQPWSESLYALRDLLTGVEDLQFWDGIPPDQREALDGMSEEQREELRQRCARSGWSTIDIRAFPGPDGEPIYKPSAEDLSRQLRIVLGLAQRLGITWKYDRASKLPQYDDFLQA